MSRMGQEEGVQELLTWCTGLRGKIHKGWLDFRGRFFFAASGAELLPSGYGKTAQTSTIRFFANCRGSSRSVPPMGTECITFWMPS
jgi:hypothetical protein